MGLHILVMMGTFYAAGHVGTSYFSANTTHVRLYSVADPRLTRLPVSVLECLTGMRVLWG